MYIKFLGPIIKLLEKKNFEIYILFNYSQSRQFGKWRDFPFLDSFTSQKNIIKRIFNNNDELLKIINEDKLKIIGSLLPYNQFNLTKKKLKSVKWILFQHGIDLFWDIEELENSDYIFLYSNYWKKVLLNFFREKNVRYNHKKILITGNPQFDSIKNFNNEKIKAKYNLPKNKKIFLFLPLSQPNAYEFENKLKSFFAKYFFIYPNVDSLFFWLRKNMYNIFSHVIKNEISLLKKIKKYCKKNGYYLIIKSRSKRILDEEFQKNSDRIFYDEQIFPSTILELMKISNNVVSYITTANGESAFAGCYHYTIFDKIFTKIQNKYLRSFDEDYFNFKGLNEVIENNSFFKTLDKGKLKAINKKSRNKFLKKYFEINSKNKISLSNFLNKI